MFKYFLITVTILFCIFSCSNNNFIDVGYQFTKIGADTLSRKIRVNIPRPQLIDSLKPGSIDYSTYVPTRNGTLNTATVSFNKTGSSMDKVPKAFLDLLTLGNPDLKDLKQTDSLKGWLVNSVNFLNPPFNNEGTKNTNSGEVQDISSILGTAYRTSFSGIFTYFPDGYYTFVSNVNDTLDQIGWYKVSLPENQIPDAIIYQPKRRGTNFIRTPLLPNSVQGLGIWGIDENMYLPLFLLNQYEHVILKCMPIKY